MTFAISRIIPFLGTTLTSDGNAAPVNHSNAPANSPIPIDTLERGARPLSEEVHASTQTVHIQAESHPFVKALLNRKLDADALPKLRTQYIRYLVDLQHVYASLEKAVIKHHEHPMVAVFDHSDLFRSELIGQDLDVLVAGGAMLKPSQTAVAFAKYIEDAAPPTLAGIARTRFLADLFGGQALGRVVQSKFGAAALYEYPEGTGALRKQLQLGLDNMAITPDGKQQLLNGAKRTFEFTVGLFDEAVDKRKADTRMGAIVLGVMAVLGGAFALMVGLQDRWLQRS